ncbi:hypothetical protein [Streptomyces sp. NPDC000229]|uniref:hypothetical protein n=1 Tax=Streptomyces sp. NPDC000229 TaxID=3154247 RepID=UPI00332B212F
MRTIKHHSRKENFMHGRITTRRIAITVVAGAATLAVLAPAASAAAATVHPTQAAARADAKLAAELTVAGYTTYLKHQKTPEAKKALQSFLKLPAGKQARFVKYLQNRDIYKALINQTKGNFNRQLKVVDPYNADVKFVTEVTAKSVKGKSTQQISFTVTETIFNIPVTSETVNLRYDVVKGKVTGTPRAASDVKNINAAITIHKGTVGAVNTGVATASTTWKATPRLKSFGKGVDKVQEVAGHTGTWKAKLANR